MLMLHTTFLGRTSLGCEEGDFALLLNASSAFEGEGQHEAIESRATKFHRRVTEHSSQVLNISSYKSQDAIFFPPSTQIVHGPFVLKHQVLGNNSFVEMMVNDFCVLIDLGLLDTYFLAGLSVPLHTYIPNLATGSIEFHLDVLTKLGGARYVVPFPTIPQTLAIDFARQVMLHQLGVPKFLQAGQQLLHQI